ncbi:hypothetical protein FOPG_18002 [Fusarium oxysporum f. sp. conglutinans race 2 54008]|nr:hypothetical protein FOVG_17693 [Fusarium oxysporum f. sp. pisi HDV247]EXL65792.1 hypothetical protein FOPG_18002 [Fusarium oxysporum f. sp. conglutinans race 2 54008]KAG6999775.1 Transcription factor atf21 [Fusarium oxysporum f. sp. conglutinans]RKK79080.1 hypothetical protein BFJ71_g16324 [Fusarium oxysporum]RKK84207.1 hypothetical protein BFJ68_g17371 [Fusarium oxysporum]
MLDGYTLGETVGDELTVYGAAYPGWELSESMGPPAFLGGFQDEVDIRQDYLPQEQLLFYEDLSSTGSLVDTCSTVKNQTLSPERLVIVADEPPLALTPSLQPSKELPKEPSRKRKAQLSELTAPRSPRRNDRGDNNTNDQKRKGIIANGNKLILSHGTTKRKQHANHKQVQERNRIAANKCHLRKRAYLARLQSDEQVMEQRHRMLSSSVDDLNKEVLQLKMQLLQHTSCNCTLIQHYIKNEAQLYIQAMELGSR